MSGALRAFLVQTRLPGVQGDNGVWSDEDIVEATSPEDAIAKWGDYRLNDEKGKRFGLPRATARVCELPGWSFFRVGTERSYEESFVAEPTDDPNALTKGWAGVIGRP